MNIVLIGYRGTGKSEVAEHLGQLLQREVVSLDREIVAEAGMSIAQIVETFDWARFRDMEEVLTARLAAKDDLILDTGGGVILRPNNVDNLKRNGTLFWLTAQPATIQARISASTERPALTAGKTFLEEIEEVLSQRTPLYQAAADHRIATDTLSPTDIAARIQTLLR